MNANETRQKLINLIVIPANELNRYELNELDSLLSQYKSIVKAEIDRRLADKIKYARDNQIA